MANMRQEYLADPELIGRLEGLARVPILLVATDFDGTIAPIVSDPAQAEADREAIVALKSLAAMPQTHVAVISGRSLSDLASLTSDLSDVHLVGSHGSEYEAGFSTPLAPEARSLLGRLAEFLQKLVKQHEGLMLEQKPAAFALHYRNAPESSATAATDAVIHGPATWPGVHLRNGKCVIELSVTETDKGIALQRIRQRVGATAVLFIGDDVTDEDAFQMLCGPDVGIKVGPGATVARFRTDGTINVARVLAFLSERRGEWVAGSHAIPIQSHSMLSDKRTIALVDPTARIVWMCLPRIDSSAVFAELLGGPAHGFFQIAPTVSGPLPTQRYVGGTFTLETAWPGLRVIDYLDCCGGRPYQRAGRADLIRVIEGNGPVRVVFAPRLDFGRMETRLKITEDGILVEGTVDPLILRGPGLNWRLQDEGRHQSAIAEFEMSGSPVVLEMRYGTASMAESLQPESARRLGTERFWTGWGSVLKLPTTAREQVLRSALVLKALSYGPTGAIAAAGTTSLPEHAGGVRNWDYRFCWPRDAALSASALLRLGATGPGLKLLDWLLGILDQAEPGAMLNPLYTVRGGHVSPEGEIAELAGYLGSRPVRVGNAAAQQVQLDVFGPIADLVALLANQGAALSTEHWRMVETMVAAVARRWREPDHGIWEVRRARQHHVHSKVMCWQTIDRALTAARYLGRQRPEWIELREEIAAEILSKGWNKRLKAFCATYEDGEPDAAALSVGLSGLLAPDDERFISTVEFVERTLRKGDTVFRYQYDDGLSGVDGGFNICTTWLIEAYVRIGRRTDAEALFQAYLAQMGPTGLLSEEYDPVRKLALGNYPQAYSHLGLINAAICLEPQA